MIAYTALLLVIVGIFSSIKFDIKADRNLSFLFLISFCLIFINFGNNMLSDVMHSFSYEWLTPQGRRLNMDLISNPYNYLLIFPSFLLTLLFLFNNQVFHYEERRCSYTAVLVFNLAALMVLATGNNFIQLLAALFVVDILSFFLIHNVEASRYYILLNMFADMILFAVSAIINSQVHSLELSQISLYRQIGIYPDFVAFAGLSAVFIKFGFFFFQVGLMGIKSIRLHRLQNVLLLSSPLAALLLLLKFSVLWRVSEYFTAYLDIGCGLTILWGFIGSICTNKIKAKIIYWQMMLWALFVELLRFHGFVWFGEFTFLLLEIYTLSAIFYLVYFYNRRRQLMTELIAIQQNKNKNILIFILLISVVTALANTLTNIYNFHNRYYIWTFAILFMFTLCNSISQVFHAPRQSLLQHHKADTDYKIMLLLQIVALLIFLLFDAHFTKVSVYGFSIAFILFSIFFPCRFLIKLYNVSFLQTEDILGRTYITLIKSLRLCGKLCWLIIDQLFLEKIIINFFTMIFHFILKIFNRLHNSRIVGFSLLLLLLWSLVLLSYNQGVRL